LSETYDVFPKRYREGIFSAISAGFFFLLVGAIFIITPNLFQRTEAFFRDFDSVTIPNTEVWVFAPVFPRTHLDLYRAVEQFCFALGVFQLIILALRFMAGSPWNKKAETISNSVFWIGAGYLILRILIEATRWPAMTAWFVFWAAMIMLLGASLIVRAMVLAAVYPGRRM